MSDSYIIGSGIIRFCKHMHRSIRDMGKEAVKPALAEKSAAISV